VAAAALPAAFPYDGLQPWDVLEDVTLLQQMTMSTVCAMISTLVLVVTLWGWGDDTRVVQPVRASRGDMNRTIAWEQHPQSAHELNSIICGGVVAVCACVGSAVTGGLFNPFLAFVIWIYSGQHSAAAFVGPILGALAASLACFFYVANSRRDLAHVAPL